jgi:hypothetical protein
MAVPQIPRKWKCCGGRFTGHFYAEAGIFATGEEKQMPSKM